MHFGKITFLVLLFAFVTRAAAQGGPPMITDDPFTPGDGHWEINVAAQLVRSSDASAWQLPSLDLNYGYGERLQLNLVAGYVDARDEDEAWVKGVTAGSVAVKWRFLGGEKEPLAISIYPRLDARFPFSNRNPLVSGAGDRYFLPVEVVVKLGAWDLNPEVGFAHYTKSADEWDYGVVLGHEWREGDEILVEVHARAASRDGLELLPQIGTRLELESWLSFIGAVGHSIQETSDERAFWNFYGGVQVRL